MTIARAAAAVGLMLGLTMMVSHLPAMLPVAVGMARAFRIRGEARAAHEAMNLAGVRRLPVVFVIDNNQWAYSTPTYLEYACDQLADRAAAYGFEGVVVDGTDTLAVYREARAAIDKARSGGGPTLIESVTLRMEGHAVHDDASYVPREMFDEWAKRDPITRFRELLMTAGVLTEDADTEINEAVKRLLAEALERAEASPHPHNPSWSVSTFTKTQLRICALTITVRTAAIFIRNVSWYRLQ